MTIEIKPKLVEVDSVFICHGAEGSFSHTFKIAGMEDSPWVNHGVSLNPATDESSPIGAEPRIGEYQRLEPEGAEWKLNCPANGTDRDFELWIQSEFTAPPYKIPMRLGHYRRKILSSRAPIGAPVIHDEVDAEVTVGSWYTAQELEGVDVEWSVDGKPEKNVPTSNTGKSVFKYAFLEDGPHTIVAKVVNPYDETELVEKHFEVHVFEESPWKQATLLINGNEVPWNTAITLLRGQANEVTVEAPLEIAEEISLWLPEDGGLDIEASPPLEDWVSRIDGKFHWTLTPGEGQSGLVTPVFKSRSVLQGWEHRCFVLSADLADEVDEVKVGGGAYPPDGIVLFRGEPQTVTLTYKPGSPLYDGYPLVLAAIPLTGLQDGDLVVTPTGNNTWTFTASNRSGTFRLELSAPDVPTGIRLPDSKVLSRNLADEVKEVLVNDVPYQSGIVLYRDEPQTVSLTYQSDSPLQDYPLELSPNLLSGLQPGDVVTTLTEIHTWSVMASNNSGTLEFELTGAGFNLGMSLPVSKVLSRKLEDEVKEVLVNGNPYLSGIVFFRDVPQTITLNYHSGSPLQDQPLDLTPKLLSGLQPGDVVITLAAAHTWTITASTNSGTLELELTGADFNSGITLPVSMVLSPNLEDEVKDVLVNGEPYLSAILLIWDIPQIITLTYHPDSPLQGYPLELKPILISGLQPGDVVVNLTGTHTWAIKSSTNRGTFKLELAAAGFNLGIMLPVSRVLGQLEDEVDFFLLDGVKILPTGADFDGRKNNTVTLDYKTAGLMDGVPLSLKFLPSQHLVESSLVSDPPFNQLSTQHSWKIKSTNHNSVKQGLFRLMVSTVVDSETGAVFSPVNRLLVPDFTGVTLNFEMFGQIAPNPPQTVKVNIGILFSVVVRLKFSGDAPVSVVGIPTTIDVPGKSSYSGKTGPVGYFSTPYISFLTAGVRTVTAEAILPDGTRRTATVLLEVGVFSEE